MQPGCRVVLSEPPVPRQYKLPNDCVASGDLQALVLSAATSACAPQLAGALTDAMAALGAEGGVVEESNWVMKQALRRNTSDEADGWKLTTAADAGATLDDSPVISLTGAH